MLLGIHRILPMSKALFFPLQLSLGTFACLYATPLLAEARLALGEETSPSFLAQVTSDSTVNTQVNQNGNVAEITGGETRGGNLFHSFQDFSVQTGNTAFFDNADNISNIFSRVTGGNISNIDGLIRANGDASLFLINPAGIIFGENARLDIGGSFYGSTASNILFEDGEFSAVDNLEQPILTINAPIGLGFRDNPGNIEVQKSNLIVSSGQNLTLLGKDLNISGAYIEAQNGRVYLGATSNSNLFDIDNNLAINTNNQLQGNIELDSTTVNVSGTGKGTIETNAGNLTLSEASVFNAGISSNNTATESQPGNITINVAENVVLKTSSIIRNNVNLNGFGNTGSIIVNARNLSLADDSRLSSIIQGNGNSGNISLKVSEQIDIENSSISTSTLREGVGNAGNIEINTTRLSMAGTSRDIQAFIFAGSIGQGNAGDIILNVANDIAFNQFVSINNQVSEGEGDAGDIIVNADTLSLNQRSLILSGTGDLVIPSNTNIGNAGNITINSRILSLDTKSFIGSSSVFNATGAPGSITIDAEDLKIAGGSGINTYTLNNFDAGEINITAQNLELVTGGKISTLTSSSGNAGNIILNVSEQINIDGANPLIVPREELRFQDTVLIELEPFTGLFANTLSSSTGDGGNIEISNPRNFSISNDGATITVDSQGLGNGGNLFIKAGSLDLNNQSKIIAETLFGQADQQPSNIDLRIDNILSLRGNSQISARAINNANGGNILIDANFIIAFPDLEGGNDIVANAREGSGGNISIATEGIFGIQERFPNDLTNDINASSEFSIDGNVTINTPDTNPVQGVTELPTNVVKAEQITQQACEANRNVATASNFSIQGRGGLISDPASPLDSLNVHVNDESTSANAIPAPIETAQGKIQPARGAIVTESGEVILTAYPTDSATQRIPKTRNCS